MGILGGVNHLHAIRAFEKAGFTIIRQGKHITMSDGFNKLTIPRNNPIHAVTMGVIIKGSGLSIEQFRQLL